MSRAPRPGSVRNALARGAPIGIVFRVGDKVQYPRPGPDPRGVGYVVTDGLPEDAPAERSYYIMDVAEDYRFFMNGARLTLIQRRADLPAAERVPVDNLLARMASEGSASLGVLPSGERYVEPINGNSDPGSVSGGKRYKSRKNRKNRSKKSRKGSRRH